MRLAFCGGDLLVAVEGPENLTFIFDIVDDINMTGGVRQMTAPVPNNTQITDHILRDPDAVTISGTANCLGCGEELPILQDVIPALKRATSTHVYNPQFFTVTSNNFVATNMVLTNYSVTQSQSTTQRMRITASFVAANISGNIGAPSYDAGGFIG